MNKRHCVLTAAQIENRFGIYRTCLAIVIALIFAFLLILSVSQNPIADFITLLIGPLSRSSRMITVISKAIPLLFTGVAISLIYSAGQINIAAEGAFFAGCVASTSAALIPGIPTPLHILLCILSGALAGGIIMGIPGILYVKYNIVTIVSALMMNYISLYLGLYIILNPLRDPGAGFEASFLFQESAILPKLFGEQRLHLGLLIGISVVAVISVILYYRPFGYCVRTVGFNPKFAQLSGIHVSRTIVMTSVFAGMIAGMGGAVETLGNYSRFMYSGFTNHGWDGIMIAVLCRNNPKLVPIGALFIAYLKTSADALNMTSNIPPEIINIIQAIVIIFIAAQRFLSGFEHKSIVENAKKALQVEGV